MHHAHAARPSRSAWHWPARRRLPAHHRPAGRYPLHQPRRQPRQHHRRRGAAHGRGPGGLPRTAPSRPLLAKPVDLSADGLTYTFKLREGVKFHNGEPLTSADVLWSWQRYLNPKTDWRRADFDGRNGLKVTEVVGPRRHDGGDEDRPQVRVFRTRWRAPICGMTAILNKASVGRRQLGQARGHRPLPVRGMEAGRIPVDDRLQGPASRPPSTASRDGYVGDKRLLVDEVKFLVVPDPSTSKAGLPSGAIDASPITASTPRS